ncbi:uncharacterized protein LOC128952398 [Oppia nitens]|uniref:uncharacterized protein LOC128952398 n=1 Tax=Oppia nitens TaxID=1686743 RepID=UPI0023D9FC75|nr:uncharacterized protein LOC128952398 [Oppia nitens]
MGNLSSCCLPKKSDDEINERTHILDNPVSSPDDGNDMRYNSCLPPVLSPTYGTLNGRTEQNQLNNTLHKLVAKVIDVSSIDNNIEQSDWNERQRTYGQRLANIKKPLLLKSKLKSNTQPQVSTSMSSRNLTIELISEEDLNLINYFSEKATNAVLNGFKVHCDESFVVQFDP